VVENFDDFAARESREQESNRQIEQNANAEWSILKTLVSRFALDGGRSDKYPFEWSHTSKPEFLRLNAVAASFSDDGLKNAIPQNCKVRFSRRPLGSDEQWVDDCPVDPVDWSLQPTAQGKNLGWAVKELDQVLSSADLAEEIAKKLAKYYQEYEAAYKSGPAS